MCQCLQKLDRTNVVQGKPNLLSLFMKKEMESVTSTAHIFLCSLPHVAKGYTFKRKFKIVSQAKNMVLLSSILERLESIKETRHPTTCHENWETQMKGSQENADHWNAILSGTSLGSVCTTCTCIHETRNNKYIIRRDICAHVIFIMLAL